MKKHYLLILLLSGSLLVQAQQRYFLNSDTRLYTSKNTALDFLGYFKYGAEVQLLSDNENGWYKVKADNLSEGYVPANFITKSLNAKDIKTRDIENPILEGTDQYYGGNHLFVLVAGLKARAKPDKNAKIREILNTGDPVAVNYLPKNQEDWVNISGQFDEQYALFTIRKLIGKRPDFNSLIRQFDQLDTADIAQRKTIAERIVALAWNSETATFTPAYQRYYAVVKQLNDPKLLADTQLNIALTKGLQKTKKPEEILAFAKKAEFILKGLKTKSWYLSQQDLVKTFGKPAKKATVSDECGVYLSALFYYYPDLEISVDESQNQAEITKVFINEHNKLVLNNTNSLDHSLSEKTFIEKYGTYIGASIKTPHLYTIQLEDSDFRLYFKDGKLFTVEIFFYC